MDAPDDTLDPWLCRRAGELSAEDAAALAKLRLHVAKLGAGTVECERLPASREWWWCVAKYTRRAGMTRVHVEVVADEAPTPAAAILACGEALGVSL